MSQMKGQDKIPGKQLNEAEMGDHPEKESRTMTVKVSQDLRKRVEAKIEKMQEMFTKDLEEVKNKQTKKNNTLEGISSRITEAEKQINELEDRTVEITATNQNIENRVKRNEDILRDLWGNIKCSNICIIEVPEADEREKEPEKIFEEIIAENFLNMGKETVNQVQEAPGSPRQEKPEEHTPRHIVIKQKKL